MRFKNFLREYDDDFDEDGANKPSLRELIYEECPGLIRRLGGKGFLYRGVAKLGTFEGRFSIPYSRHSIAVYRRKIRTDRQPMSTQIDVHRALNRWFEKEMGWPARSGMFVFGEKGRSSAQGYGGKSCLVFPVGKFSYCWSPLVRDLYEKVDGEVNHRNDVADEFKNSQGGVDMDKLDDYMRQFKYTNNHLDKAIETENEIMIDCEEALFIEYHALYQVTDIKKSLNVQPSLSSERDGDDWDD